MRTEAVTVGTTAVKLAEGGIPAIPNAVAVQVPSGGSTIYVGGADVTVNNGIAVSAGAIFTVDLMADELWGVIGASTQEVRVMRRHD